MVAIRVLQRLLRDSRGATAVEYGLIVALIVIAVIGGMQSVANGTTAKWAYVVVEVLGS